MHTFHRALTAPIALSLAATAHLAAQEEHWPQFRGVDAHGISEASVPPTKWNLETGENVAWRTPIPGLAHSSPVVWGERVFVSTVVRAGEESTLESLYGSAGYGAGDSVQDDAEHSFRVYCLELGSGTVLWEREAHAGVPRVKRHPKSSHANPTPACDADVVVVSFGSDGLFCFDHAGELRWQVDLGYLNSGAPGYPDKSDFQWGYASSPVLDGERVLVQCDHEGQSFLTALDRGTGETLWRTDREENSTWSTPTVHHEAAGGRSQVIVNGYQHLGGYDLEDGSPIWWASGGGDVPVPTPVVEAGVIYLTSAHGRERPIRAILADAEGEVGADPDEDSNVLFHIRRRGIYMQTPLVLDGLLYCCSDGGNIRCYRSDSGELVYTARVGEGLTGFSGSPVSAAGRIYYTGENGTIHVVQAGEEFELLAVNDMTETCMATPAIVRDTLLIRTRNHLVALRADKD